MSSTLAKRARFTETNDELVEQVVESAIPKATKIATSFWVGVLQSFLAKSGASLDLKACSATQLNDVGRLHVARRNKEGGLY